MSFRRLSIFVLLLTIVHQYGLCQTGQVSSVLLKSGLTITGKIVEMDPSSFVKMELPTGFLVEIKIADIEKIQLSQGASVPGALRSPRKRATTAFKDKGYYMQGSFGLPVGTDSYGDASMNISMLISGGYTINRWLSAGVMSGLDFYWWPNTIANPLAVEIKGRFQPSAFTPFYSLQCGYGFVSGADYWTDEVKGGLYWSPIVGVMSKNRENSGWFISTGLRFQRMSGSYLDWIWDPVQRISREVMVNEDINFVRMDLRFGFFFE